MATGENLTPYTDSEIRDIIQCLETVSPFSYALVDAYLGLTDSAAHRGKLVKSQKPSGLALYMFSNPIGHTDKVKIRLTLDASTDPRQVSLAMLNLFMRGGSRLYLEELYSVAALVAADCFDFQKGRGGEVVVRYLLDLNPGAVGSSYNWLHGEFMQSLNQLWKKLEGKNWIPGSTDECFPYIRAR